MRHQCWLVSGWPEAALPRSRACVHATASPKRGGRFTAAEPKHDPSRRCAPDQNHMGPARAASATAAAAPTLPFLCSPCSSCTPRAAPAQSPAPAAGAGHTPQPPRGPALCWWGGSRAEPEPCGARKSSRGRGKHKGWEGQAQALRCAGLGMSRCWSKRAEATQGHRPETPVHDATAP